MILPIRASPSSLSPQVVASFLGTLAALQLFLQSLDTQDVVLCQTRSRGFIDVY